MTFNAHRDGRHRDPRVRPSLQWHEEQSHTLTNSKSRQAPGTSFEPYPIPVLADPKKIIQALDRLRDLKSFPSADAVNTTTGPQLPKYVSAAFGSLELPWKPGHLRSAYGAICCHKFKPKNITDDIFLAQILGHNSSGQTLPFP
jgi:hypothetical protein